MADGKLEPLELAARAQLEASRGQAMSDDEWQATKARLMGFVRLLRKWDRNESNEQA